MRNLATFFAGMTLLTSLFTPSDALAGREPAKTALENRNENMTPNVVQNRFFLKEGRYEFTGAAGYVPNNPMVTRTAGSIFAAYHISERFAAEGIFMYFPDLDTSDLKGLALTLVDIGNSKSGSNFKQPVEKMLLDASFAARWSPIYGKINLIGERVLNFDFYFTGGLGMISSKKFNAVYDNTLGSIGLDFVASETHVPVNVGIGLNLFLNQSLAVKLDARSFIYYGENIYASVSEQNQDDGAIHNDIVTSVGVSYFIPKMKPRLMDF